MNLNTNPLMVDRETLLAFTAGLLSMIADEHHDDYYPVEMREYATTGEVVVGHLVLTLALDERAQQSASSS